MGASTSLGPGLRDDLIAFALALIAGFSVFVLAYGLAAPRRGRPGPGRQVRLQGEPAQRVAAWLDARQMGVTIETFFRQSLLLGIPLGVGLALLVGSVLLGLAGVVAGFIITATRLEQARDRRMVQYTKRLASACDMLRTAYGVNPSLKRALESVAQYAQPPVREDFQEILVAASQERFVEGLQAVAERRRSIVFDTVATALVRASEASGEVNDMLVRLAASTRQNVEAYEEAVVSQINARSNIQWGTFGPWLIFAVFRVLTLALSAAITATPFHASVGFFGTPEGNLLALSAAAITLFMYRHAMQVAERGLVVRRIASTAIRAQTGQAPLPVQNGPTAQTPPVAPASSLP